MIDVVTIGLGYIGLPTSALMASKGKILGRIESVPMDI